MFFHFLVPFDFLVSASRFGRELNGEGMVLPSLRFLDNLLAITAAIVGIAVIVFVQRGNGFRLDEV
ncbi:MAG: hypothetical protein OXC63_12400 [Aestuariivita sp.]|nr:hypothetical protein [Aestuariivita sp.]MCY4347891.1 hypothetical protein [Aestuariivita sp.]